MRFSSLYAGTMTLINWAPLATTIPKRSILICLFCVALEQPLAKPVPVVFASCGGALGGHPLSPGLVPEDVKDCLAQLLFPQAHHSPGNAVNDELPGRVFFAGHGDHGDAAGQRL